MRDRKSLFLLILALIIATVAFVLISIWGYHFYYAGKNNRPFQKTENQKNIIQKPVQPDSLQSLTKSFNPEVEINIDSLLIDSSVDINLASKIIEYQKLRNEIAEILRKKSSGKELALATEKISQLQQSIEELKNKNDTITRENEKLNQMVKELMGKNESSAYQNTNHSAGSAKKLPVLVSHLRFMAYDLDKNQAVTNIATNAEGLAGSFQVSIKSFNTSNSIYIVVIRPNGKTLHAGNTGSFMSVTGKKIYSGLIHFERKDNGTRLSFTIDAHNFQKGKYVMQVYHQGVLIGRLTRTLF